MSAPSAHDATKPAKAFVFSTGGDQFGRVSYFKVVSGSIKADQHLTNLNRGIHGSSTGLLG